MKIALRMCPFCGGEATVKDGSIYSAQAVQIRCQRCDATSKTVLIDHPAYTTSGLDESTRYTKEQAIKLAADAWNRRTIVPKCKICIYNKDCELKNQIAEDHICPFFNSMEDKQLTIDDVIEGGVK